MLLCVVSNIAVLFLQNTDHNTGTKRSIGCYTSQWQIWTLVTYVTVGTEGRSAVSHTAVETMMSTVSYLVYTNSFRAAES